MTVAPSSTQETCSVRDLLGYFLRLGTFGFGGPIACRPHGQGPFSTGYK
jgi:hypothetical protein